MGKTRWARFGSAAATMVAVSRLVTAAGNVPSPSGVLGLAVGHNRVLASYGESDRYVRALAQNSPRVRVIEMGPTVEGRTMLALAISASSNIARLDELRRCWARIADPRGLEARTLDRLLATLPTCAFITAGIHAN